MDALIMAGGQGTRLDADTEKPLFEIDAVPMIDRVIAAVDESAADRVVVAVSPHTPETREHLGSVDAATTIETPGEGYVADLDAALDAVGSPALTIAADLPLLDGPVLDRVIDAADTRGGSLTVCVPTALKRRLGASVDTTMGEYAPTGVNVVADSDPSEEHSNSSSTEPDHSASSSAGSEKHSTPMYTSYDARLAINVNRQTDAALAEALRCE